MRSTGSPSRALRIAAVQCDVAWEDRAANLGRAARDVAAAADQGARLVVFPEMFPTGFSMRTEVVAEPEDGPTAAFLHEQAVTRGVHVGGSFACSAAGRDRPVNRFLLAAPTGVDTVYDKLHPFSYSGEGEHYAPGREIVTTSVDGVRVTPFVCYDLRFADVFWDAAADTDAYVVVASWPAARKQHWRALLAARAIENQAYVVGVNRTGTGGGVAYEGGSVVFAPFGEVVGAAGTGPELLVATVDPDEVGEVRSRYPFLADRRRGEVARRLPASSS